ncbi:hypothetical protein OAC51_09500, partial [Flavobacteriaceae bacterium]|nr:hypothetical protein [Flavobacteriaceae bacterium]
FRQFDPTLGRFTSVDPLGEERQWVSTYNFGQNNPILRVDPSGLLDDDWKAIINQNGSTSYVAEQGDSAATLSSQYGISQENAEQITGTTGDTKIAEGTEISGQTVNDVTGSEVLKLDVVSPEGKNEQTRFDHFLFARDHSTTKGGHSFLNTNYFSHTTFMDMMSGSAIMNIGGESINIKYDIPMYRSGSFDRSSKAVGLSNNPSGINNTTGTKFRNNQANIHLDLFHSNGNYSNQSYIIKTTRSNSNKVYGRLGKKFPQYLYSNFKRALKN